MMNKSKKFRFDSFATEFSEENIKKETEFPDNDSGIGEFLITLIKSCRKEALNWQAKLSLN